MGRTLRLTLAIAIVLATLLWRFWSPLSEGLYNIFRSRPGDVTSTIAVIVAAVIIGWPWLSQYTEGYRKRLEEDTDNIKEAFKLRRFLHESVEQANKLATKKREKSEVVTLDDRLGGISNRAWEVLKKGKAIPWRGPSKVLLMIISSPAERYPLARNRLINTGATPIPFAPFPGYTMDAKIVALTPDSVPSLKLQHFIIYNGDRIRVQEISGRCPHAEGMTDKGEANAKGYLDSFTRSIIEPLIAVEAQKEGLRKGPFFLLIFYTFGASSSGAWILYDSVIQALRQRLSGERAVKVISIIQVPDKVKGGGDPHEMERRRWVALKLIESSDFAIIIRYDDSLRDTVNEILAFLQYVISSPGTGLLNQLGDLPRLLRDWGCKAFTATKVMNHYRLLEASRDPRSLEILSPIDVGFSNRNPFVLCILAPSSGLAEQADSMFKEYKERVTVACYETDQVEGETRGIILIPLTENQVKKGLEKAGKTVNIPASIDQQLRLEATDLTTRAQFQS